MLETLKRLRPTGARLVLVVGAAYVALSVVNFFSLMIAYHDGIGEAAHTVAGSSLSIVMVLVLVSVLVSCAMRPATPRAAWLLRAGGWLIGLAAALEVVFLLLGLAAGRLLVGAVLEVLGALLEVSLKVAAAVFLFRVARGLTEEPKEPAPGVEAAAQPTEQPRVQPASWTADEAAGAVWTRAGDAATGAAASGWGHPGAASGGWRAEPAPAELTSGGRVGSGAARGPWATAGQLADGSAPETVADQPVADVDADGGADAAPGPRQVSWTPANRDE